MHHELSRLGQIAEQGLVQPHQLVVAHVQKIQLAKIGKQTERQLAQPVELAGSSPRKLLCSRLANRLL